MTIPGFTASTSLYNAGGRYRSTAGRPGASANARTVLPQLPRQIELLQCLGDCYFSDDIEGCRLLCYWKDFLNQGIEQGTPGGGGGGGVEPERCRPRCSTCRSDSQSETGRSVTCTTTDCNTITAPC
jgi:hypothetical protein